MPKQKPVADHKEYMIVTKFRKPTRFDLAPYGTIFQSLVGEDLIVYYIQVGKKEDNPEWELFQTVLVKAFEEFFSDDEFVSLCLALFEGQNKKDLVRLLSVVN